VKASIFVSALLNLTVSVSGQTPRSWSPAEPKPQDVPRAWSQFIGAYGPDDDVYFILERGNKLILLRQNAGEWILAEQASAGSDPKTEAGLAARFHRNSGGQIDFFNLGNYGVSRRQLGPSDGNQQQIKPVRPVDELTREALTASPPSGNGPFRKADLVELARLDTAIHLDIRYATSNDFLGAPVYTQARAFLQRPAGEALLRVLHKLQPLGYGLLIHDAYRPWYITKIFWEATPPEGKIFVADPAQGSRHNRGCAVDLTLYDLGTGKPIEMPGTYDEMSPRSFPNYPGGTSLQRWHRDLLRRAMESEGFTVYESEWWHFDYKDWGEYPILNVPFEKLDTGSGATLIH
jgi:D-alanyl-D-alanine dipeptidase